MFEKKILHTLLSRIRHGALLVRYWDGETRQYGNGESYFTLTIHSPKAVRGMLSNLTLGFGEAYTNGLIDVDGSLENIGRLASENRLDLKTWRFTQRGRRLNRNTKANQKQQIQHHYDLGNEFYKLWLDKGLTYSSAYFRTPNDTLEQAQTQKLNHVLRKLNLSSGQRLLDIGSGWGTLLITAAQQYGVTGLGVTLSEEQLKYSKLAAKNAGVDKQITFELHNYQDLPKRGEKFDRIVSVGMFEHVGRGNHHHYYKAVHDMLHDGGISVLHTITNQVEVPTNAWIDKYIFPGGYLPSTREIVHELPGHGFRLLDYENLRLHYALTLEEWRRRFNKHKQKVESMYDEQFYRMWDLWLASSAAGFRYGDLDLSHFVFTKGVNSDLPLTREYLYRDDK